MPIRITCTSCDKKLSVRDELAGKKVKCPGCGAVFVAAADAAATGVKAVPPRSAPPSAKDKVSAKPMAKKPAPPPIKDTEEEMDERPVRRKKSAPLDDEDDDDRPLRKSTKGAAGGSKMWLWLALAGVLVLGSAAGVYFMFFTGPTNTGPIAKGKGGGPVNPGNTNQNNEQAPVPGGSGIALADLVPGDAFFFASVSAEAWNAKALEELKPLIGKVVEEGIQKETGVALADIDRVSVFTVTSLDVAKKSSAGPTVFPAVVLVQAKKPLDQAAVTAAIRNGELGKNKGVAIEFVDDRTMVTSLAPLVAMFKDKKGKIKAAGVLERALNQATTSKGLVVAVNLPPELAQLAGPVAQGVPPELFKVRAVLAGLELTDKLALQAALIMDDSNAAQEVKKAADGLLARAGFLLAAPPKEPELAELFKLGQQALKDLKVIAQDKEVTMAVQADAAALMKSVAPVVGKVQETATWAQESNNLKQIGLAWHNYHVSSPGKSFPPQTIGKGLSWRVAILPYIEQDELYRRFKLDEPWDSPTNKQLIPLMPKIYESVGGKTQAGFTFYQTFVGPNTINKIPTQGIRLQQITDGSTNTLLVVEAAQPVVWTKPDDIVVTPNQPITLGGTNPAGALGLYGDAGVRRIPRKLDQQILRWLIDPADGNIIPNFDGSPQAPPMIKGNPPRFKGGKVIQDK